LTPLDVSRVIELWQRGIEADELRELAQGASQHEAVVRVEAGLVIGVA